MYQFNINTSLKSLSVRKLLDHSAFAYLPLLGPSGFLWVLIGPSVSCVLLYYFGYIILGPSGSFFVFEDGQTD